MLSTVGQGQPAPVSREKHGVCPDSGLPSSGPPAGNAGAKSHQRRSEEPPIAKTATAPGVEPRFLSKKKSQPRTSSKYAQKTPRGPPARPLPPPARGGSEDSGEAAARNPCSRQVSTGWGRGGVLPVWGEQRTVPSQERSDDGFHRPFPAHRYMSLNRKPKMNSSLAAGCHYVTSQGVFLSFAAQVAPPALFMTSKLLSIKPSHMHAGYSQSSLYFLKCA